MTHHPWETVGEYRLNGHKKTTPIVVNMSNMCVQEPVGKDNNVFATIAELQRRGANVNVTKPQLLDQLRSK